MKLTGAIACLLVAFDCSQKALGAMSQTLFAADALWLWWVCAALWVVSGLRLLVSA